MDHKRLQTARLENQMRIKQQREKILEQIEKVNAEMGEAEGLEKYEELRLKRDHLKEIAGELRFGESDKFDVVKQEEVSLAD